MSRYGADALYALLPAVYRQRDADLGGPLRDLIEVLASPAALVEGDVFDLYESWFIETCPDWAVPYIGDLIGVRGTQGVASRRAEVANTLGYRRAKGTVAVLAALARDVTGWPARIVEYFALLATTQNVNHVRAANLRTPNLRRAGELELLGGPFETASHTAEVRRIVPGRGRYDIPNVGIFLWRLQAYPLARVVPHPVDATDRRFTFNVLGLDGPLFNAPQPAADGPAGELAVPGPIRRRAFHASLASYYPASLEVWDGSSADPLPAAQIAACDLSDWSWPTGTRVAVDPALGRLAFPAAVDPAKVRVSYRYGFSDDLGGGPYQRAATFTAIAGETTFRVGESAGPGGFATIAAALAAWGGNGSAVIEIADSRTYAESLGPIAVPAGHRLELRAADLERPTLRLAGELTVTGGAESRCEVNGLLIAGGALRLDGGFVGVRLQHATLVPGGGAAALVVSAATAAVAIERAIIGAVRTDPATQTAVSDSIVDPGAGLAAYAALDGAAPGGPLTVSRSTVTGAVVATELPLAENSLFLAAVTSGRRQAGCVRFSFVPPGSRTPRRFHCQPALPDGATAGQAQSLAALVRPRFTSLSYGAPGYCQLTPDCPEEIAAGAEDESEMGVFSSLKQPQRADALRIRLDEYLRVGLAAGIFFAT